MKFSLIAPDNFAKGNKEDISEEESGGDCMEDLTLTLKL